MHVCRQLEQAHAEQAALEQRLAAAGEAEGRHLHEIRDLEAASADRCAWPADHKTKCPDAERYSSRLRTVVWLHLAGWCARTYVRHTEH